MADTTYEIAKAYVLENGLIRYEIEYYREGNGIQRPTFDLHPDLTVDEVTAIMKVAIDEERRLNENLSPTTPVQLDELLGITF
jgi:hypothetical protein